MSPARSSALILLLPFLSAVPVQAQITSGPAVDSVLTAERIACLAFQRNDTAGIARFEADGYILTDSRGVQYTKEDDLRAARDQDVRYTVFRNEGMQVSLFGDVAIVRGQTILQGTNRDGSPLDVKVQFTDTVARIDGRWQLVAGHVSRLPVGASGRP